MPVDRELLEILVCPETRQPVRPATAEQLESVNRRVRSGELRNRGRRLCGLPAPRVRRGEIDVGEVERLTGGKRLEQQVEKVLCFGLVFHRVGFAQEDQHHAIPIRAAGATGALPRDCMMLPVRIKDRLVMVLYADGAIKGPVQLPQIQRLLVLATAAVERCILERKRGEAKSV